MVWPKTTDDDGLVDSPPPQPSVSDSEPTPSSSLNESSSQESNLSSSSYPPFPQQAPVLLAYNSSNDSASSPPANSYEDYYHSIPSAQPRTHHYYPRITHSISATESSTQLPSPPDSNFVLSPTPPEQNQQQVPRPLLPQQGGQLFHDRFDQTRGPSPSRPRPPARQFPRQSVAKNDDEDLIGDNDDDDAALNSILDGVGKMHITMGRDHSGRWRIRRTGDTLD